MKRLIISLFLTIYALGGVVGQNIINSCQLWKKRKNEIKY